MIDEVQHLIDSLPVPSVPTPYVGNPQAFVNRPSDGLAIGDEFSFHGGREPNLSVMVEKPEHYAIALLRMQGATQREIATKLGYSEAWVSQICRQPWFRERLFQMMRDSGKNIIEETLRLEVLPSIQTLVDVRDNVGAPAAARKSAADSLLDRYLGKAVQRVESYDGGKVPSVEDAAELDKRIAEAEAETRRLAGETASEAAGRTLGDSIPAPSLS